MRTEIVQEFGKKYSAQQLLELLQEIRQRQHPQAEQPTLAQQQPAPQQTTNQWFTRYEDITVPVPESVPIEACLSKDSRQLLQSGCGEGGRNANGAKLVRDHVLLKNEEDLNEKQKNKLEQVKIVCPILGKMHELKEEIRQVFEAKCDCLEELFKLDSRLSHADG